MTQIGNTVRRMVHSLSKGCALSVALCVGFVTGPAAYAQILYGTLTGTVRDASGATVPNAKVEALETSQGAIRIANSDSDGTYRITDLVPGNYKITISAPNFASFITDNLPIDHGRLLPDQGAFGGRA